MSVMCEFVDALQILSQSLANPHESFQSLKSQSLTNPLPKSCKFLRILSQSLTNPHNLRKSSPKVSRILANPFLIISNTPYLVDCIQPSNRYKYRTDIYSYGYEYRHQHRPTHEVICSTFQQLSALTAK